MSKQLRLPPFKDSERHSGSVEHLYRMYNKQYRELGYMYCIYHKDIVKSCRGGSCIKCCTHPCAKIVKDRFKDTHPSRSQFMYLRYFAFKPLTKCGTNGRQIHIDYDKYYFN